RAAERRGERAGDDLHAFTRGQPRGFGGGGCGIDGVSGHEAELLAHHPAEAGVDEVAHDLVALEVEPALDGEVAGEWLEDPDLVLALELLLAPGSADAQRQRDDPDDDDPLQIPHGPTLPSRILTRRGARQPQREAGPVRQDRDHYQHG